MKKLTKRLKVVNSAVDKAKTYALKEAIAILKNTPKTKFDETVEVAIKLNVDPKQAASASIRGTIALPHGTGKKVRVIVFCKGEEENRADCRPGQMASCFTSEEPRENTACQTF